MEINKQLFENVLSGKLKGTFVLRDGCKVESNNLSIKDVNVYPIVLIGCRYTYQGRYDSLVKNHHLDIVDFIPDTNMKENKLTIEIPDGNISYWDDSKLTIEIPEGKEIDWDESKKQNKIVLKDKQLTYENVCEKLFRSKDFYSIFTNGEIKKIFGFATFCRLLDANNAPTKHQLECILAKNKLATVAVYLNNGWKPSSYIYGWFICVCGEELEIRVRNDYKFNNNIIFKSKELAKQAIEILGEETVKLALEPLGI